eukprot:scaffold76619_cov28-Tisochrysis_lutea.AAC.1
MPDMGVANASTLAVSRLINLAAVAAICLRVATSLAEALAEFVACSTLARSSLVRLTASDAHSEAPLLSVAAAQDSRSALYVRTSNWSTRCFSSSHLRLSMAAECACNLEICAAHETIRSVSEAITLPRAAPTDREISCRATESIRIEWARRTASLRGSAPSALLRVRSSWVPPSWSL